MNTENIKQSINWAKEFPEDQHCMVNYFFHLRNDYTLKHDFKASEVPDDAKMCFGGLTIKRAGLDLKQGTHFAEALMVYWDLPFPYVNEITNSLTMEKAIKKIEKLLTKNR